MPLLSPAAPSSIALSDRHLVVIISSFHPACSTSHYRFGLVVRSQDLSSWAGRAYLEHSYHCARWQSPNQQSWVVQVEDSCHQSGWAGGVENRSCWQTVAKHCVLGFDCQCCSTPQEDGIGSSWSMWLVRWVQCWSGLGNRSRCYCRWCVNHECVGGQWGAVTEMNERSRCEDHHLEGNAFD